VDIGHEKVGLILRNLLFGALSQFLVWLWLAQNTVGVQQFFVQAVLGCFFEAELKLFAGCVNKSQQTSQKVNRRQQKSRKVNKS